MSYGRHYGELPWRTWSWYARIRLADLGMKPGALLVFDSICGYLSSKHGDDFCTLPVTRLRLMRETGLCSTTVKDALASLRIMGLKATPTGHDGWVFDLRRLLSEEFCEPIAREFREEREQAGKPETGNPEKPETEKPEAGFPASPGRNPDHVRPEAGFPANEQPIERTALLARPTTPLAVSAAVKQQSNNPAGGAGRTGGSNGKANGRCRSDNPTTQAGHLDQTNCWPTTCRACGKPLAEHQGTREGRAYRHGHDCLSPTVQIAPDMTWERFLVEVVRLPPSVRVEPERPDAANRMAGRVWLPAGFRAPTRWGDMRHLQFLRGLSGSFAQQAIQPGEFDAHGMRVFERRLGICCLAVTPENFHENFWGAWGPCRSDETPSWALYARYGCEPVDEQTREIVLADKRFLPSWPDVPKEPA